MQSIVRLGTVRTITGLLAATCLLVVLLPSLIPTGPDSMWYWGAAAVACLLLLTSTWLSTTPHPAQLAVGWTVLALALHLTFVVGDLVAMLFALPLAVAVLSLLAGQVRPRTRKALLTLHVGLTGIWLGVAVVMLTLAVMAAATDDPARAHSHFALLEHFDNTILAWSSVTSIASGLAVSLTGKWGLAKHYWVLAKFVLSIVVLAFALAFLHGWVLGAAARSAELLAANGTTSELGAQPSQLVAGFAYAVTLVLTATVLSVYKPWGRIRTDRTGARARTPPRSAEKAAANQELLGHRGGAAPRFIDHVAPPSRPSWTGSGARCR